MKQIKSKYGIEIIGHVETIGKKTHEMKED